MGKNEYVEGLGGWLIFWHIGLWVGLLGSFYFAITGGLQQIILYFYGFQNFDFSGLLFIILFFIQMIMIYAFFGKNSNFPVLGIAYLTSFIGILVLYLWIEGTMKLILMSIILGLIPAIIWIVYLKKSIRVKNTFVNGKSFIKLKEKLK